MELPLQLFQLFWFILCVSFYSEFFPFFLLFIIHSSVVSKGYCSPISQNSKGWTWCSFSSYAILPWSSHVVVCHHWCHTFCFYLHSHQNSSHSVPTLGCCDYYSFIILTGYPTFHICGHLQSGNAHECDIWVDCWLYASRMSHCQHDLQNSCIHYNQPNH